MESKRKIIDIIFKSCFTCFKNKFLNYDFIKQTLKYTPKMIASGVLWV